MLNHKTKQWCEKAVSEIIFPPDKEKVYLELADHIYDHYDYLIEQGYDKDAAIERTFEAMGDPFAIAYQLGRIHHPFWGYFLRCTRILLAALFAITVITFAVDVYETLSLQDTPVSEYTPRYDPYVDSYVSDDVGITTRLMYKEPRQRRQSDGYTLELTRAAWSRTQYTDPEKKDHDSFVFQIEISNPLPWACAPNICDYLWAKDSLGNLYYLMNSGIAGMHMVGNITKTASQTWTLDMWLYGFASQDADWIDIYYDRDGRNIKFRIDLPGGEAQ